MSSLTVNALVSDLEVIYDSFRNDEKAIGMSNYMKGKFSFYGIGSVQRRSIVKDWKKNLKFNNRELFWELMRELWNREQREFQYAAIDLLLQRKKKEYHLDDGNELQWLIRNRSWWDTVDLISSNYLGTYIQLFPVEGKELINEWRVSENLWLKRSCLIYQLKYREKTDSELLRSLIRQFAVDNEFFIQKAIGWSLRQLSKTDPESVKRILQEATKYL
jgi:3-methyladenine DNA glycosylase AlkD